MPENVSDNISNTLSEDSGVTIKSLQQRLCVVWLLWLGYRSIVMPVLLGLLLSTHPDIIAGIVWQLLWLIPALVLTPWMVKGKSPYALLLGSMVTLLYLGASGVVVFSTAYGSGLGVIWIYIIDLILIFLANIYLFKLLKKLPSMNNS